MTHPSIQRWLEEHTLVEPSLLNSAGLDMLICERLSAFESNEQAYIAELARSTEEVDRLIAAVAVPETWLFRYPRSFDLLLEFLQQRLASGASSLRMLSIGCAAGQEPYSMAMTALHAGWSPERIRVEGVDRNGEFLRAAAIGGYGASSIRTEIPTWAVRFLHRSADTVAIDPAVRALVRFTRMDVTGPAALRGTGPYDVIFCRNLLIYLNAAARERLLDSIGAELALGGLLFVGHAEQIMRSGSGHSPTLRTVNFPHAFALERCDAGMTGATGVDRIPTVAPVRNGAAAPRQSNARPEKPPAPAIRSAPPAHRDDSLEDARELADSGRAQDAEAMIRAIMARIGPTASAVELLGMIRMSVNDVEGGRRLFEQAVYLEPHRSASLLQLALISERSGDARRAANYWDRARRASTGGTEEQRR